MFNKIHRYVQYAQDHDFFCLLTDSSMKEKNMFGL